MQLVKPNIDYSKVYELSQQTAIPQKVIEILMGRGLTDAAAIKKFLYPTINDLYNPFLMKNMLNAVKRIDAAINSNEKILIFGDKDTDGITSVTILYKTLKGYGANIEFMIPAPEDDYDINLNTVDYAAQNNIKLVLTVDCGINAVSACAALTEKKIDLIITDHHEPQGILPEAFAIINPKQKDCLYPDKMLAGCGVSFKLASAYILFKSYKEEELAFLKSDELAQNKNYTLFLEKYLPVAAIGSVADVVPLVDENRIISKLGYEILKTNPPRFAEVLFEKLEISSLNGDTIGYRIAPLLNASRRMKKLYYSLDLLLSEDKQELYKLTDTLLELNELRKLKTEEFFEAAVADADTEISVNNEKIIVLKYAQFEHGVTGLVANKIKELFNCPVLLFIEENGMLGGAGRSVDGLNLFQLLTENFSDYFRKFGGHKYAVGASMLPENFEPFKKAITEYFNEKIIIAEISTIHADAELQIDEISNELYESLKLFEPFGASNQKPLFCCEDAKIISANGMGVDNKHLNINLQTSKKKKMRAVSWNNGKISEYLNEQQKFSAVFNIEENIFRNNRNLQLKIIEFI